MIGQIIRQVFDGKQTQNLYTLPIVNYCLFRSFDELTQNLIFRISMNSAGSIERTKLKNTIINTPQNQSKFYLALQNMEKLCILTRNATDKYYQVNQTFIKNLKNYLFNEMKDPVQSENKYIHTDIDDEFFNLLYLISEEKNQNRKILQYCKLGQLSGSSMTKEIFNFIRAPTSQKISILIKGYLLYKKKANWKLIRQILFLSMKNPNAKHIFKENIKQTIYQLQSIKLVRVVSNNQYIISEHLHNFAFKNNLSEKKALECKIIIETNFKVYTQVKPATQKNHRLLKQILNKLLEIQNKEYSFGEELIVGVIERTKLQSLFKEQITTNEYFSFFRQYMNNDLSIEKDLGKWNKLKFLGLEGPSEEKSIPNNVKQQVKFWQTLKNSEYKLMKDDDDDEASDGYFTYQN